MRKVTALLLLTVCLAAPLAAATPPASWQEAIRPDDRRRLAGLWRAWTRARSDAAQDGADLKAFGRLADPDAGAAGPPPPPGAYRCRMLRIGRGAAAASGVPAVAALPVVPCSIRSDGAGWWLEQHDGAQRIAGRLWNDGERLVFLGAMALAGEAGVMAYGADRQRDQVGVLTMLGPGHWRLELPWPRWQSDLCLVEIMPA